MAIQKLYPLSLLLLCLLVQGVVVPANASVEKNTLMMVELADEPNTTHVKTVDARVEIDAPPVFVWQTLTNYGKLKEVLPGYKKTNVVADEGSQKIMDVAMSVSRLLPSYAYRVRVNENRKCYELKLNRIAGDFNSLAASYQLYTKNNGAKTVLVYSLKIDPGKGIPDFALDSVLKSNTEKTLKAIQNYAQQEHRKSLIGQR